MEAGDEFAERWVVGHGWIGRGEDPARKDHAWGEVYERERQGLQTSGVLLLDPEWTRNGMVDSQTVIALPACMEIFEVEMKGCGGWNRLAYRSGWYQES